MHTVMELLHVLLFWFWFWFQTTAAATIRSTSNIAKPGCQARCGNVTIPYPFGLGPDHCYINPWFNITCNTSFNPPKPLYTLGNVSREIYDISDSTFRMSNQVASRCYDQYGNVTETILAFTNMGTHAPFSFSQLNKFTSIGCGDVAVFLDPDLFTTGCLSLCSSLDDVKNGSCMGGGCCQTSVRKGLKFYFTTNLKRINGPGIWPFNPCTYSFMGEQERFIFQGASDFIYPDFKNRIMASVPILVDWVIGNLTCSEAQNKGRLACQQNSYCVDSDTVIPGYRCICNQGYEGNPYLDLGCLDIDECQDANMNSCERICKNIPGNYTCSCPDGYFGDGRKTGNGCIAESYHFPVVKFSLGMGFGFLATLAGLIWLYFGINKRNLIKLRQKMFQKNGGLLLQQRLMNNPRSIDSTVLFTAKDLEVATNSYAKDMILGRGGFGTVYKGILRDKRVVAIKKSKEMNDSQIQQFINEVIILTQVNHRNVVKLLGCCLETDIPLLVYEYVSNGTLFDHIHSNRSLTWLSWENRLRIASESASALSYLHSATTMPVIHRDVKCVNILLDENYTTKIADFGASRLIPIDQKQIETLVQGTFGYLDPEYFNTGQLNEKGDVYSFGVVLAELLTGKKPVLKNGIEDMNLAKLFVAAFNENRLFQFLDRRVVREGPIEQLKEIAELVKRCLNLSGDDRPTMKAVEIQLEGLRKFTQHPWAISNDEIRNLTTIQVDLYSCEL
ncbi:wall-associated receptor kinase 2-like [Bidens hawaiensis]|uniref:wall-associated receptor kinase 2-like n=1 Tax=Bidens hawaiensis TaxID=980011 RepID=UPI0040497E91